jgi:hypothetical protein
MEEGRFQEFLEKNYTYDSNSDSRYFIATILRSFLMFSQIRFIFGDGCGSCLSRRLGVLTDPSAMNRSARIAVTCTSQRSPPRRSLSLLLITFDISSSHVRMVFAIVAGV